MPTKTKPKPIKQQRPERELREVIAENKGPGKGKKLIDKQFTAFKAVGGNDGANSGLFDPTDEDMAAINQFTARPVTAEEVACFNTLSCNDVLDRDDDRFTKECVDDFAKLKGPLSSVGKSYMVGHDYTKLPVGRIFGVGTTDIDGVHFLTNKVYIPKLPENESFLANQEFGIYWAVSVGVMLEDSSCSVCQSAMIGNYWTYCVENGHEKGLFYDPDSDEKDAWGWALPVDPDSKGAVKCTRELFSPNDFYELSQVFLGAQYDAQIGSKSASAVKGILKAASAAKVPILNLGHKEAEELPMQHVSEEVREAYAKGFEVTTEKDGTITWVDSDKMVWSFDPEESEVMSLGEKSTDDDEGGEDGTEDGRESKESDDQDSSGSDDALGSEDEDGSSDPDESEGEHDAADADEEGLGDESEDDDEDEADGEPKSVTLLSADAVLAACRKANIPEDVIKAVPTKGVSLDKFVAACSRHIKSLEGRATLGDQFLESKRAEALKWYVKSQQTGGEKRVKVKTFKRILDALGDNVELIEEVIEEHRSSAQKKFPASVRRSTTTQVAEDDGIDQDTPEALPFKGGKVDARTAVKVRHMHG